MLKHPEENLWSPDGILLTKSVLKTGLRAQSTSSHLPPKGYVTQPERQEGKAHC